MFTKFKRENRRVGKFIAALLFFGCSFQCRAQQTIDSLEWGVDLVTAFGQSPNKIAIPPAPSVADFPFTVNISSSPTGLHTLLVRTHSNGPGGGFWSETNYTYFYKKSTVTPAIPNIQQLEYFIDTDPGEGNAIPINVAPATQVSGISFNPNIGALAAGFHVLFIRSLDQNGVWSVTNYTYFYKLSNVSPAISTVTRMEYFIDTDLGEGNGNAIAFAPATNVAGLNFNANVSAQAPGFHVIFIRSLDADGKWSITNYAYFFKAGPQQGAVPDIVKIEYFIDNDPGYFSATNIPVTPAADIPNKAFSADVSSVAPGLHYLFIRSLDTRGLWSVDAYDTFRINNIVVPLTLISFDAAAEKDHVNITWNTTLEQGLSNFEVQRSADGIHFTALGSVSPLNAATGAAYHLTDTKPLTGINYYRLKTIESNGSYAFSNIRAVIFSPASADFVISPNPADQFFVIKTSYSNFSAEIINNTGAVVRSVSRITPGEQINTSGFSAGLYYVKISAGKPVSILPIVIIH